MAGQGTDPAAWPTAIQPHGWLLIVDPKNLRIRQVSANIAELCGKAPAALLGAPVEQVLGRLAGRLLRTALENAMDPTVGPLGCRLGGGSGSSSRTGWVLGHRTATALILEVETTLPSSGIAAVLPEVGRAIRRYRAATDVAALSREVAADIRRLTGFDRAMVLRLAPLHRQMAPVVIAADGADHVTLPADGTPFAPHLLAGEARAALEVTRVRLIADAAAIPVGLEPPVDGATGLAPDLMRVGLRAPFDRVARGMADDGLGSVMTVSLSNGGRLWGLIWCDSAGPRLVPGGLRAVAEAMGEIAAAQITALEERETAATRMAATRALARISTVLKHSDDIARAIADAVTDLKSLFGPDSWLAAIDGTTRTSGAMPPILRWLSLLDGPNVQRLDGVAAAHAPGIGAALRIDVSVGGQVLLLRNDDVPFTQPQLDAAVELHRLLVERHADLYRARTEEKLHRLAFYDSVTNLPNRTYLLQELQRLMATGSDAALLVVNLDRFKSLKSSLGEETADNLLSIVAKRLEGCLGSTDRLARIESGEFAALIGGDRPADAAMVLSFTIKEALKAPVSLAGREIFVTTSQGLVESARLHGLASDVLRNAEIAAYEAEAGGGGAKNFDSAMRAKLTQRYELYDRLRHAIYFGGAIKTVYQPIIDLDQGELCGFEVLARWMDPEKGTISPVEFIPVAEETGLIVPLGNQVLVQACRHITTWNRRRLEADPKARPLTVSVNLSSFQLDPSKLDLLRWVKGVLQLTGADPSWLVLEITESGLIAHAGAALEVLEQLRDLGVHLAIDDFGTGYSSLSYLQRLPVSTIKIDRSFVAGMDGGRKGVEMVRTIVQLARVMNFSVTAEGVETDRHLDILRGLGCRRGQGYYFAKPLDPETALKVALEGGDWGTVPAPAP